MPLALAMGVAVSLFPGTTTVPSSNTEPASQLITTPRDSLSLPTEVSAGDHSTPVRAADSLSTATTLALLRSYLVYTACSIPPLIDHAPALLHAFTHSPVPGLKAITEAIVRRTFFAQFVPGETVEECIPTMRDLRGRGVGSVLNYSAEAECEEGDVAGVKEMQERRLREVYKALEGLGQFEKTAAVEHRGTASFALKITGLIDPAILHRASNTILRLRPLTYSNAASSPKSAVAPAVPYPGTPIDSDGKIVARISGGGSSPSDELGSLLSLKGEVRDMGLLASDEGVREGDLQELRDLWGKLRNLGEYAREQGVRLMIDAEHTWYQPALDAYTLLLSEEFNRPPKNASEAWRGPLIYGTYQCYLTRQPGHLRAAIKHAEESGYALGIKLVRGAYFVQERKRWKDEKRAGPDPIWPDKPATDKCYDESLATILSTLSKQLDSRRPDLSLNVIFGTHNAESCRLIVEGLEKNGLAEDGSDGKLRLRQDVRGKIGVAQLYGMKDDLTDFMAGAFDQSGPPVALKYIAYGNLGEVMPFLGRRAIENKAVMSGEGGAAAERKRLMGELKRRILG